MMGESVRNGNISSPWPGGANVCGCSGMYEKAEVDRPVENLPRFQCYFTTLFREKRGESRKSAEKSGNFLTLRHKTEWIEKKVTISPFTAGKTGDTIPSVGENVRAFRWQWGHPRRRFRPVSGPAPARASDPRSTGRTAFPGRKAGGPSRLPAGRRGRCGNVPFPADSPAKREAKPSRRLAR